MLKFKIGDLVWVARCGMERVKKLCPTCAGKREVTLILGNDDHVILPCKGCVVGFDLPRGYITEYEYIAEPEKIIISRATIYLEHDGETVEYRCENRVFKEKEVFATEMEAQVEAQKIKAQLEEEQATRAKYIKKEVHKNFSWNASYHIRHAKKDRESAEYHDKMAVACKARSKKE